MSSPNLSQPESVAGLPALGYTTAAQTMEREIRLLQFFIAKEFHELKQDSFQAGAVQSNLYVPKFPYYFSKLYAVTCWRKDSRFHKEVIEYATDYGTSLRSPHMDIEPVKDSVLFRWHTHRFPTDFVIERPTTLTVRVILDGLVRFESYLLIEKKL